MADMIIISTVLCDEDGSVAFPVFPESSYRNKGRRVSRSATLDGGCVINDGGFSHSDRTMDFVTGYEEGRWNTLNNMVQNHPLVQVSTPEGLFLGSIETLSDDDRRIRIRVLVKEKLTS